MLLKLRRTNPGGIGYGFLGPIPTELALMSMSPNELATRLGGWHGGHGPLYRQLACALQQLLETGEITRGTALPPERSLAAALAVSRTTVTAAYTELRSDGWLEARRGSATRVATARHSPFGAHRANGIFATLVDNSDIEIDLTINVPDASPVVKRVLEHPADHLDVAELTAGHGYHPAGHPTLRGALSEMLTTRGLPTTADQLLITTGAQQAVALAVRGLTRPGDNVAVEETTYPGALDVIASSGLNTIPLDVRDEGVSLSSLRHALDQQAPRLVYLIPTFHNPTSALLSREDRLRLLRLVHRSGVTLIDDMTVAELNFGCETPPPMAALDTGASVVTIGSLSKVYWGGLRVGWIRAHESVVTHLQGVKVSVDMGSPTPTQVLAAAMLNHHDEALAWRHERLRDSLDALTGALEHHLPEWQWKRPVGGPQLWVRIPGTDATGFSQRALRQGIALVPGPLLAVRRGIAEEHLRIPLYPPRETLERAIEHLARLWHGAEAADHRR